MPTDSNHDEQDCEELMQHTVRLEENRERSKLKSRSFLLTLFCIGALLFIYLVDSVTANCGGVSSSVTTPIVEIFKSLLPLLLGYLFATETRKE